MLRKRGAAFEVKDTTVVNFSDDSIHVDENSNSNISNCSVEGSGEDGILVSRNSNAIFSGNIVCNDNGLRGFAISFGSRATLNGNTIGTTPITCDSRVLSRGDTVCP